MAGVLVVLVLYPTFQKKTLSYPIFTKLSGMIPRDMRNKINSIKPILAAGLEKYEPLVVQWITVIICAQKKLGSTSLGKERRPQLFMCAYDITITDITIRRL